MTTKQAIEQALEWNTMQIEDSKRDLAKAADQLARRAAEAKASCDEMLADKPCSLMWVEFAAGDAQRVNEAKARLTTLLAECRLLQKLAGCE